jgi:hypothetical protein
MPDDRTGRRYAATRSSLGILGALAWILASLTTTAVAAGSSPVHAGPTAPRCPKVGIPVTPPVERVMPEAPRPRAPTGSAQSAGTPRLPPPEQPGTGVQDRPTPPDGLPCRRPPVRGDVMVPSEGAARAPEEPRAETHVPRPAKRPRSAGGGGAAMLPRIPTTRAGFGPAPRTSVPPALVPRAAGDPGPDPLYLRSLMYSGALGIAIASLGVVLVGRRRRQW